MQIALNVNVGNVISPDVMHVTTADKCISLYLVLSRVICSDCIISSVFSINISSEKLTWTSRSCCTSGNVESCIYSDCVVAFIGSYILQWGVTIQFSSVIEHVAITLKMLELESGILCVLNSCLARPSSASCHSDTSVSL